MRNPSRISVVIPLYNEDENVEPLIARLIQVLESLATEAEVILVDDGSSDRTWSKIEKTSEQDSRVRGFRLTRNFGHQNAILAGLSRAAGDVIITMDGDLQHPPEKIPELISCWQEGYDVVNAIRETGPIKSPFKRLSSKYYYKLLHALSGIKFEEGSSDFRLLDRRPLKALLERDAGEIFLRGEVQWTGYKQTMLSYQLGERHAGVSKFSLKKMLRLAGAGIVLFSDKPLRIGIWIGVATGSLAFLELAYILFQVVRGNTVPGWASTVGVVSLLFGILFFMLGIIGIYLSAIYKVLLRRPQYIISDQTDEDESGPPTGFD